MARKKAQVTTWDVARKAGVSQSAVSRAFTRGAGVSEQTRRLVYEAARELGYDRAPFVKSSGSPRSSVALVMGDLSNPFYSEVIESFSNRFRTSDFVAEVHCVTESEEIDNLLMPLVDRNLAGVIVASVTLSSASISLFRSRLIPIVLFNRTLPSCDVSSVSCDNYTGGQVAAEFLLNAGHKRIAYIAGREDTSTNRERERGFVEGLAARNQKVFRRVLGHFDYFKAFKATEELLAGAEVPDAIFGANDLTAIAAIDAIRRDGRFKIPDDIAIIGFDDIRMASWPGYELTTVRQRLRVMTEEAISLLERLVKDPRSAGISRMVTGPLIERSTTRPARTDVV